jgi:hypothetical protein
MVTAGLSSQASSHVMIVVMIVVMVVMMVMRWTKAEAKKAIRVMTAGRSPMPVLQFRLPTAVSPVASVLSHEGIG